MRYETDWLLLADNSFSEKKETGGIWGKGMGVRKCIAERRKAGAIQREFVLKAQSTPL